MPTNDPAVNDALKQIKGDERAARGRRLQNYKRCQESLIDDDRIPHSLNELHRMYLQGDALANHFQHKTLGTFWWLFVLVGTSAFFFEGFAHFVHEKTFAEPVADFVTNGIEGAARVLRLPPSNFTITPGFVAGMTLLIYVAVWIAILSLHRRARQTKQYQEKFHSYRALAEGLRVQFFWLLLGIDNAIDESFATQNPVDGFPVLKLIEHFAGPARHGRSQREDACELALHHWIEGQERYFTDAVKRADRKRKLLKFFESACFVFALALPCAWILGHFFTNFIPLDPAVSATLFMIVFSSLAMIGAGLFHGYVEKLALGEHIESYDRIRATFHHYKKALDRDGPMQGRQDFLEFGRMALSENSDWVKLHRWRPLEPPRG